MLQFTREDGRLDSLVEEAEGRGADPRAWRKPPPGDMTWTFRCEQEFLVTACRVEHDMPAFGFCVEVRRDGSI